MTCVHCRHDPCDCSKCIDFWPVSHRLPRIHVSEGKILRGQAYEVFPPLVKGLLSLHVKDVMVYDGGVMVCVCLERNWSKLMPRIQAVLRQPNNLQFNGAITSTRKPQCKTLWVNHHQLPAPEMRPHVRGLRCKTFWKDDDLDKPLTCAFMPLLIQELLKCHNVGRLHVFHEGFPGICITQKFSEPWAKTIEQVLAVLEIPFIKRFINPPENSLPQHLWNPQWKWNPPYAAAAEKWWYEVL